MHSLSYQAYTEGALASRSPTQIITDLYRAALRAVRNAGDALQASDILGRSANITKAFAVLTELLIALNHEKAPELSFNLQRLYSYMQQRLLFAHSAAALEPMQEVERLLTTLAEGWETVARATAEEERKASEHEKSVSEPGSDKSAWEEFRTGYGGYYREPIESSSALACSF